MIKYTKRQRLKRVIDKLAFYRTMRGKYRTRIAATPYGEPKNRKLVDYHQKYSRRYERARKVVDAMLEAFVSE